MTKQEKQIIIEQVSYAWFRMAEYEYNQHLRGYFTTFSDVTKFEEKDDWYCKLRNDWYQLSILADLLKVDWSCNEECEKAFAMTTEVWSYYRNKN